MLELKIYDIHDKFKDDFEYMYFALQNPKISNKLFRHINKRLKEIEEELGFPLNTFNPYIDKELKETEKDLLTKLSIIRDHDINYAFSEELLEIQYKIKGGIESLGDAQQINEKLMEINTYLDFPLLKHGLENTNEPLLEDNNKLDNKHEKNKLSKLDVKAWLGDLDVVNNNNTNESNNESNNKTRYDQSDIRHWLENIDRPKEQYYNSTIYDDELLKAIELSKNDVYNNFAVDMDEELKLALEISKNDFHNTEQFNVKTIV